MLQWSQDVEADEEGEGEGQGEWEGEWGEAAIQERRICLNFGM